MDADQKDWAWIVWKCVPCTKKGSWVRTVICCAQKGMLLSSHALDVWCARLTQTHTEKEDDQHEHVALHEASRRFTKTRPRENSTSEMRSGSQVLIAEEGSKEAVEAHNEVKLLQVRKRAMGLRALYAVFGTHVQYRCTPCPGGWAAVHSGP
eukprot:3773640-Rhodomonas_salina.1